MFLFTLGGDGYTSLQCQKINDCQQKDEDGDANLLHMHMMMKWTEWSDACVKV